jgi:hypothetical protein
MARPKDSISADPARGGGIVLKKRWERIVFIAGLAGCVGRGTGLAPVRLWS